MVTSVTTRGLQMKIARLKARLSVRQVAERLGCQPVAVNRYEAGTREPNLDTLVALAQLYRVPVGTFFGEDGPQDKEAA